MGKNELANDLSAKIAEAYNRDELTVLCFELGLDPDELEEGTKSEFIWEIISWCERRGRIGDLIDTCRRQRPHIHWPDPPPSTVTDGVEEKPISSPDEPVLKGEPKQRRSINWLLVLAVMIALFLCAWLTITGINSFIAGLSPIGQVSTSVADVSTPQERDDGLPSSDSSVSQPDPSDVVATISIPDIRNAGLGLEEVFILGHGADTNSVTWSPDGKQLATASDDGHIRTWDVTTGQRLQSLTGDDQDGLGRIRSIAWSPAGNLLLSSTGGAIQIWDAETGEEVRVIEDVVGSAEVVNWSPDNASFAWGNKYTGKGAVYVWSVTAMRELFALSGHGHWVSDFAWSPDGALLASGGENKMVRIWNAITGDEIFILTYHNTGITGLAWSPDSTMLASVSEDALRIIEASTGQQLDVIEFDGRVETVDWSPNGDLIAIGGYIDLSSSGWNYIWVLDAQTGAMLYAPTGHTKSVTDVAWSPDGSMLASASLDDTVRIWRRLDDN